MKVVESCNPDKPTAFSDIAVAEAFEYSGDLYIKMAGEVTYRAHNANAFKPATGTCYNFSPDHSMKRLPNAKVVKGE